MRLKSTAAEDGEAGGQHHQDGAAEQGGLEELVGLELEGLEGPEVLDVALDVLDQPRRRRPGSTAGRRRPCETM